MANLKLKLDSDESATAAYKTLQTQEFVLRIRVCQHQHTKCVPQFTE